ncbi:MAG: radical SAM protein [Planctomycetota bacterium]|jgi:radical SAM protein with 4Fe4S-binding SPASM domain
MMSIPFPTSVEYEVTRQCNFNCVHCYHDPARRGEAELDFDGVAGVLDSLAGAGVLHLTFTGGEPFARRDFHDILEAARERRFAPTIITNGYYLDSSTVEWLARIKVYSLAVTLTGMSEAAFGAVTGRPGALSDVLHGIERAKSAGIPVEIHVPLLRENLADLKDFMVYGKGLRVPVKISPRISPREGGSLAPLEHEIPEDDLAGFVKELELSCRRPSAGDPDTLCPVGREILAVSASGEIMPCIQLRTVLGTLPENDIAEVWNSSKELVRLRALKRSDYEKCSTCDLFASCHLCPGVGDVPGQPASPAVADPIACRHVHFLAERGLLGR